MRQVVWPVQTILEKTSSLPVNHIKSQRNGAKEMLLKHIRYHPFSWKVNTWVQITHFVLFFLFLLFLSLFIEETLLSFPTLSIPFHLTIVLFVYKFFPFTIVAWTDMLYRMQTCHSQQGFSRFKFKYLIISLRLVIKLFISGVCLGTFINLFILRKPNAIPICCNCCKKLNPNRSNSIMINRFSTHTIYKDILYLQCWFGVGLVKNEVFTTF